MNIDVRTLVVVLGITHLIQMVVFLHQYKANKTYQGIGWWLLWSATEVAGFGFILLRGIPSLAAIAITFQNALIVLGTIFLYVGVMRFLDKKENRGIIIPLYAIYVAALVYFISVNDNIIIRSVIINATLAAVSFVTARSLVVNKTRSIAASANFNSAIFLIHGFIFAHRAVMILAGTPVNDFFTPTLFNLIPYLDALIVSLLWTFGFIIMLNQRLHADVTEANEHFELIFNTSPDAACITTLNDGIIREMNGGFAAISGFTRDEAIGKPSLDINIWVNPDDRANVIEKLREKGSCQNYEAVFQRKDGSRITGLMSATIISLHGIPHILSVTRNIDDRKRAEEALRETNEYLENLVNYANAPIVVWDPSLAIVRFNHAFERLSGYDEEEVKGKTIDILFSKGTIEHSLDLIRRAAGGERWETVEIEIQRKDGESRVVLWNSANVLDKDGKSVVATIAQGHDITDRRRAEDVLIQSEKALRASNAELEQFNLAMVGREMRMIDLKQEIDELCHRLGEPQRYETSQFQTDRVPGAGPASAPPGGGGA